MQKVEDEVNQPDRVAGVRCRLDHAERGDAVAEDAAQFAVDIGSARTERRHRRGDRRVFVGPVCPVGLIETSAALGACLLVLVVAVALDRRPYRPGKRNYVPIMIIAVAGILVLGRHLLTLVAYN